MRPGVEAQHGHTQRVGGRTHALAAHKRALDRIAFLSDGHTDGGERIGDGWSAGAARVLRQSRSQGNCTEQQREPEVRKHGRPYDVDRAAMLVAGRACVRRPSTHSRGVPWKSFATIHQRPSSLRS